MKKGAIITAISALLVISVAMLVTTRREWIQNKVLDAVIKKISPSLPFKIESYQLSKKMDYLRVNLRYNTHTLILAGNLNLKWHGNANGWTVRYAPEIQVDAATPLHWVLQLDAPTNFKSVKQADLSSDPEHPDTEFVWKEMGIDLKKPMLKGSYRAEGMNAEITAGSATYTDPTQSQHAVSVQALRLLADLQGELITARIETKGAEVLWDDFYSDIPLADLPLSIATHDRKNFSIELGAQKQLSLQIKRDEVENSPIEVKWQTSRVGFTPVAQWLIKTIPPAMSPLQSWSDLELKGGNISSKGSVTLKPASDASAAMTYQIHELDAEASNLSFRSLSHQLMAKNVSFSVPYRASDRNHQATLEAGQIYFKKLPMRLKKTKVTWSDSSMKTEGALPLEIQGLAMKVGQINATFGGKGIPAYQGTTSLKIEPSNLSFLNRAFCLPADRIPPASMKVDFSSIEVSPGVLDPTGKIELDLFNGKIELNEIGFYDLTTEVPEIDFDVEWKDINLQDMGEWSNFGEIKGTVEGYAHDVSVLSTLPTHYDFFIQVRPLDRTKTKGFVEFAPAAMKNFVKIFTGEDLDEQIPGVAGWLMFGWPSRVFGGYDVQYAGISLQSSDGLIRVETLDPPEVVSQTRKHFILYGPRFKMPIRSTTYPLVLDATAMSNFVHQMATRFGSLKGDSDEIDEDKLCHPPEL